MAQKNQFEQIVENQTKLMEKLSSHTNAWLELFTPETPEMLDKAVFEDYFNTQKEVAENLFKVKTPQEVMDVLPASMNKLAEANFAFYNHFVEYAKTWAEKSQFTNARERWDKSVEISKNLAEAVTETTAANTKLIQEYFA